MTSYLEQIQTYQNFNTHKEMDEHFEKFRKQFRFELTNAENEILFKLKAHAVKVAGVAKITLDSLVDATGYSLASVKRALSKGAKLGIIKRFKTRKKNGSKQGATVYQFQSFEPHNEPLEMSHRQDDEKPCESKDAAVKNETESLISLIPSLNSFSSITYQKDGTNTASPIIEKSEIKISLRRKMSHQLQARNISNTTLNEFAMIGYGSINKLLKQDASIPKQYLEDLVYKKFLYVLDIKKSENPFGLFTHLIRQEFDKLLGNTNEQCELELKAKQGIRFTAVPQWMIDDEQDLIKKARLIKTNEIAERQYNERTTNTPEWFKKDKARLIADNTTPIETDVVKLAERKKALMIRMGLMPEETNFTF